MSNLDGKVVLVTGAAGGIGRPLCRALVERGCRLGLLGRTEATLVELAEQLRGRGGVAEPAAVDLRRRGETRAAIDALAAALGPADALIHNAGIARVTSAASIDVEDVEEMLEVNYLGGVYAVEAVLPAMLRRGGGQLLGVSSLAALRGMAGTAGYSASKAAFATFLESLRPALRRRGIYTSTCYLGFVRTAMSDALPLSPWLFRISAEGAARRIVRTLRRRRREAYFPWYDAWGARLLQRFPPRLFDAVMRHASRLALRGDP